MTGPRSARSPPRRTPAISLTVSELFRLCRDLLDIHAVRNWCQARGVALRVLSGPLSNLHDLAANDATTAVIINVITAVGQFQRDIQNELTVEGIAAAEAEGRYRGPGTGSWGEPGGRANRLADLLSGQGVLPRPSA
ncbi:MULTISPECIES: recombinase family protein [unclassified Nonomuraea]|uniref:recombinase family protein n=1 Tax=unclassified Nonomuraea TaxID=2593643 RepID=UPI0033CE959A